VQTPVDPVSSGTTPATSVAATSTTAAATTKTTTESFTERLADQMKRIAAHAESSEKLKNGATLYHLADGAEIEQVEGKTPYVVKTATPKTS
jgi:hypothetical protein